MNIHYGLLRFHRLFHEFTCGDFVDSLWTRISNLDLAGDADI